MDHWNRHNVFVCVLLLLLLLFSLSLPIETKLITHRCYFPLYLFLFYSVSLHFVKRLKTLFLQISMNFDHPQINLTTHSSTQVQTERRKKTAEIRRYAGEKYIQNSIHRTAHNKCIYFFLISFIYYLSFFISSVFALVLDTTWNNDTNKMENTFLFANRRKRMKVRKYDKAAIRLAWNTI